MLVKLVGFGFDPDLVVKVSEPVGPLKRVTITGSQFKMACTLESMASGVKPSSKYQLWEYEYQEVKHDHIVPNQVWKSYNPDVDTTYVMRVLRYNDKGFPVVSAADVAKAERSRPSEKHSPIYGMKWQWYGEVTLSPSCVRFV